MDYFAMVGGHQQAVFRLELHQELQDQLDKVFTEHAGVLSARELVVVPFERENFHPDESEVLEIQPFDLPEVIYDPLQNIVGWPVLPADDETLSRVYCIFAYDAGEEKLVFQVIGKTQRLTRSSLNMILQNNAFTQLREPGLVLGGACHAVFFESSLRFKSMWWLKQIFDIGDYYRAATDADVERFAELQAVKVEDLDALKKKSGQWVRTRIAYILDSGVLTAFTPQQLVQKATEFGVKLSCLNEDGQDKLIIPKAGKELRSVLKFLEEEYYEGPITGAAYEANSKRRRP